MKIVAELGSNWKSFDDCKNAIALAKSCGAHAIKFQLYTHEELYGTPGKLAGELDRDWIPLLANKAKATGIEFMCTAFSVDGIEFIDQYVTTHKLASSEMCHVDMLSALKATLKPILISTGAQVWNDIVAVSNLLKNQARFLYCEAAYPANHIDMRKLNILRTIVKQEEVGFSDHSTDIYNIPLRARDEGAFLLEKHFNPFGYKDTPDAPHSIGIDDFIAMTKCLKNTDIVTYAPTREERDMILKHKRRLKAIKQIKKGEKFDFNKNFGIFRSLEEDILGGHPGTVHMIHGKIANKDINPQDPVGPNDLQ
jgi:N-acetylneuraminate synthase